MIISERQKDLIDILTYSKKKLSAKQLAQSLTISLKSVRNDIQQINQQFSVPIIHSKSGEGYWLEDKENQLLENLSGEQNTTYNVKFELFSRLLDANELNVNLLADELFISESTLDRLIRELNQVIQKRDPSLCIQRKNNQLVIQGKEEQKRKLFNIFLNEEIENYQLSLEKYTSYFEYCDLDTLSWIIIDFQQKHQIVVNDFFTISFILHVAVMLERVHKGSCLPTYKSLPKEPKSTAQKLAENLMNELRQQLDVEIPAQELPYVERLFLGVSNVDSEKNKENQKYQKIVLKLISQVKSSYGIDFSLDEQLTFFLGNHIESLYKRAVQNRYLKNPLTEELKNKFPFIYNISVYAAAFFQEQLAITFTDDEIAYIALHFLSSYETINKGLKKKILFISPYGVANKRLVQNKLTKLTNYSIELVVIPSIFDLNHIVEKDVDLILTTEFLRQDIRVPVYKIDKLLTDEDVLQIESIFQKEETKQVILQIFFKKELFFPHQNFIDQNEIIHFLSNELVKNKYVEENYGERVLERERLSSTSFGNYYALPHAIQRNAKKNGVAVCLLDRAVDWNGKKVKLVLLLALREERDSSFEQLFEQLVGILQEAAFVKKLAKQDTFEDFLRLCEVQTVKI